MAAFEITFQDFQEQMFHTLVLRALELWIFCGEIVSVVILELILIQ